MEELKISPKFTIDDIHKIRKYHYGLYKDKSFDEYHADLKKSVDEFQARIEERRKEQQIIKQSS
ncbi:MAG: hypothetical protein LBT79_05815 [Elusimicrobiota bacterium]|jgi:hypothetical protein|nr:hypothetical protein [Elusimicrobiota bacterium]